jgi:hypothetical protein
MNTFKFLNSSSIDYDNFAMSISDIRSKLYSYGICWTDSAHGKFEPETPFRVVLHTRRENVDFKNPMVKECNGLVFEFCDGWNLIAMPQYAFCTNKISMRKLVDMHNAGYYDVYEVLDATMLTLYFYNGSWVISSTKGYDVGNTEMVSGMTFMDAIKDLMATKYKAFSFDVLNPEYSYTIALRHSKYHIFDETKHLANRTKNVPKPGVDMNSYIMVMAVSDPSTFTFVSKQVSGLPTQNPLSLRDGSVSLLVNYARSAYAKYAKAYQLQNFKYKPLYGYILRAKHRSVPDEYSTIYIESELYKSIKYGLYKNNAAIRNQDYNKLVVQMSANHDRYGQFQIMFQQFNDKFHQLKQSLDEVSYTVAQRIIEEGSDVKLETKAESDKTPVEALVDQLVAHFKSEPDITPGIIKDTMYSKEYVQYLSALLE